MFFTLMSVETYSSAGVLVRGTDLPDDYSTMQKLIVVYMVPVALV